MLKQVKTLEDTMYWYFYALLYRDNVYKQADKVGHEVQSIKTE